ncbi:uncharacterized protein [Diadema antillarum]|uniref:uncharacterized protein n=1 Tax=Diadema antillarum TaxID=105358 RepID=UPI003A867F47
MKKEEPSDVFILFLVTSSPVNHERRQLIRRTYGRNSSWPFDKRGEIKTLFILGVTDKSIQEVIDDEAYRYGDIVQEDFTDSYHNLTRKTVAAFKWANRFCRHANFVMKLDDDVMLHQKRLLELLQDQPAANFSAGEVLVNTPVVRKAKSKDGKWYLSEEYYPNQTYPPYMNGHIYLLSSDLVEVVYQTAVQTPLFPWEDVFRLEDAEDQPVSMNILRKQCLVCLPPNHCGLCLPACVVALTFICCALISSQNSHLKQVMLNAERPSVSKARLIPRKRTHDKGLYLLEPIDDHNYQYFHNPVNTCMKKEEPSDVFMLILVTSSPANHERRQLIRRTYGRNSSWPFDKRGETKTLFILGVTDKSIQEVIDDEAYRYGDIVQEDFTDSYHNLTRKTVAAFKWANRFCRHANFVMKLDDDVMLHQKRLLELLQDQPAANFSAGEVLVNTPVVRKAKSKDGKWYLSEEYYPNQTYPPYMNGHIYLLSSDLVEAVYQTAVQTPLFPWEDVFVGICLQKLRVELTPISLFLRINYPRFVVDDDKKMVARMKHFFAVADISPDLMELMWRAFRVETL